jgi:hypothetical protein
MKRYKMTFCLLVLVILLIAANAYGDDPPTDPATVQPSAPTLSVIPAPAPPVPTTPAPLAVIPTPAPPVPAMPPIAAPAVTSAPVRISGDVTFKHGEAVWRGPSAYDSATVPSSGVNNLPIEATNIEEFERQLDRILQFQQAQLDAFSRDVGKTAEEYARSHTSHREERVPSQTTVVVCTHHRYIERRCVEYAVGKYRYRYFCPCGRSTCSSSDYHHHHLHR